MNAAAKLARGQSGYLPEAGGKMALAAKAAGLCHLSKTRTKLGAFGLTAPLWFRRGRLVMVSPAPGI
jgi:hypothetical protein